MKITVFSSNQPRHISLARELGKIADEVFFISEVNTIYPGKIADFFKKTEVMQQYFDNVIKSEKNVFGDIGFLPKNVRTLAVKSGDLNLLDREQLQDALESDVYVVFGASYIKEWLIDFLVQNKALNIHMGISPYYRGSSCNFWALYDNNPSYVGATIHMLSKGLDSGNMLFHCLPNYVEGDTPFDFSMRSVLAAHYGLCESIRDCSIFSMERVSQNKSKELRYTKNADFTDVEANEFLSREYSINSKSLNNYPQLLKPLFY
ncbi:formyltransferase family protein [Methylophilaceae bacterium]|nr:formyltransferase family protein [Methylophilaceae bacterium]